LRVRKLWGIHPWDRVKESKKIYRRQDMKCKHDWEEAPYPEGMILLAGTFDDMGEEKRVVCKKCGELDFIRIRDLGSLRIKDEGIS
jgi:hypothetical protein